MNAAESRVVSTGMKYATPAQMRTVAHIWRWRADPGSAVAGRDAHAELHLAVAREPKVKDLLLQPPADHVREGVAHA